MEIAENANGVQPKMAAKLEQLFTPIEKAADNIRAHKHHQTNPCTWKDSTQNTMFLD
jgi:hypothetical protein